MSRCNCFSLQLVGGRLVGRRSEPQGEVWWQLGDGQTDRCYIAVGTTKEGYLDIPFSSSFWEWHNWIRSMEQGSSAFDPGERDERCNV